jgi:hypothetical protein
MNLIKIFNNPNRWIKNGFAKYKDGTPVPFCYPYGDKPKEPWAMSLYGAIAYYTEPDSDTRNKVMSRLSQAIERYTGKNMFVAEFNDLPDTSFEDLTKVLQIYSKLQ